MKTEATRELEAIITEFEIDILPRLREFSDRPEVKEALRTANFSSNDLYELKERIRIPYCGPNYFGVKFDNNRLTPVLVGESKLDEVGIFDRVYQAILKEARANLSVDGKTFFYPAMGHDWRIARAWPETRFIAVDPDEKLYFEDPNVYLVKGIAQDYERVKVELDARGLPIKGSLILKGSQSAVDVDISFLPDLSGPWITRKVKEILTLLNVPKHTLDHDFNKKAFQRFVADYYDPCGFVVAFSGQDISSCDAFLDGFKKQEIISAQFRETLHRWHEFQNRYTYIHPMGFWRITNEPFAYVRA